MKWWIKSQKEDVIDLRYASLKDPLPDVIFKNLHKFSRFANEYQSFYEELKNKLSIKLKVPEDYIFLTAGIDEAIFAFGNAFGSQAYIFTPTFISYGCVRTFGGHLNEVPSFEGSHYAIDSGYKSDASLIFLANPNNPVGYTSREEVLNLVRNNPRAIVFIDEAYAEFADLSVIDQVSKFDNLVVARSFSKAYGMAGNRIGYIVADPQIIDKVKKFIQWSNVSTLSVGAAIIALEHEDYFSRKRVETVQRRLQLEKFLKDHKFVTLSSLAICTLIQFQDDKESERFNEYVGANHILVNRGNANSNIGLNDNFIRISIGTENQMKRLFQVIRRYKI